MMSSHSSDSSARLASIRFTDASMMASSLKNGQTTETIRSGIGPGGVGAPGRDDVSPSMRRESLGQVLLGLEVSVQLLPLEIARRAHMKGGELRVTPALGETQAVAGDDVVGDRHGVRAELHLSRQAERDRRGRAHEELHQAILEPVRSAPAAAERRGKATQEEESARRGQVEPRRNEVRLDRADPRAARPRL